MYYSDFCSVEYNENENVVLLSWKQPCSGEQFREPEKYSLELLEHYQGSSLIIDVRNGFEEEKEDIEWEVSEFIPKMSQTDCKYVIFIESKEKEIKNLVKKWRKEFENYFTVLKTLSIQDAFQELNKRRKMVTLNIIFVMKANLRKEFYKKLVEEGIIEKTRQESGNIKYEYYCAVEDHRKLLLIATWENSIAMEKHLKTEHYQLFKKLKAEYIKETQIEKHYLDEKTT